MTDWLQTAETGLADGTDYTTANSDDGTAGFAMTQTKVGGGTVKARTTNAIRGALSIEYAAVTTADQARCNMPGIFSSLNIVFDGAYYTPSMPSGDTRFIEFRNTGNALAGAIGIKSTGKITAYNQAGTLLWTSTASVNTATSGWRIGVRIVPATSTTGRLELSYYSTATATSPAESMTTITNGDFGTLAINDMRVGKITSSPTWAAHLEDDYQISDTRTALFGAPASYVTADTACITTGTVTSAATRGALADVATTGTASPTAGAARTTFGQAASSIAAGLVTVALLTTGATATTATTATLTADATVSRLADASSSSTATLDAGAIRGVGAGAASATAATLPAGAALTTNAATTSPIVAGLSSAALLTSAASTATTTSVGLTADGIRGAVGTASVPIAATLTASAAVTSGSATASVTTATATATASRSTLGSGSTSTSAALTADVIRTRAADADLPSSATLNASAVKGVSSGTATVPAATLTASASVSAAAVPIDITVTGSLEPRRWSGSLAARTMSGSLDARRWKGEL